MKQYNNRFISIFSVLLLSLTLGQDSSDSLIFIPNDSLSLDSSLSTEKKVMQAKEPLGFNVGVAASVGLLAGETFENVPTGATVVISTPYGFKIGPLDYTISLGVGSYTGTNNDEDFNPMFYGVGGNLTLAGFVFAEGHVGMVGEGTGIRGFTGVTLERLMKRGLNLPVNLLVGSEVFYSTDMAGAGNSSGWASIGIRLDYGL